MKISDSESVGTLPNEKLPIVSLYTRALTEITKNNGNIVKSIISSYDEAYTVDPTDLGCTSQMTNGKRETCMSLSRL